MASPSVLSCDVLHSHTVYSFHGNNQWKVSSKRKDYSHLPFEYSFMSVYKGVHILKKKKILIWFSARQTYICRFDAHSNVFAHWLLMNKLWVLTLVLVNSKCIEHMRSLIRE